MRKNIYQLFENLDYHNHLNTFSPQLLDTFNKQDIAGCQKKKTFDPYFSVDPSNQTPFPPELDDLIRLHFLVISRKVTTNLQEKVMTYHDF